MQTNPIAHVKLVWMWFCTAILPESPQTASAAHAHRWWIANTNPSGMRVSEDDMAWSPPPIYRDRNTPISPLPTWAVSTAAVSWSKDEQVHFLLRQAWYTPQPLVVFPAQFGTKSTENRSILKFLQCLCCLTGPLGLGQEHLRNGSCCDIYPLHVGWWVTTGGGSLLRGSKV